MYEVTEGTEMNNFFKCLKNIWMALSIPAMPTNLIWFSDKIKWK